MSYKVPLPTADLSATDIRDTIGIGNDNDVSHYIVRAKIGGESPADSELSLAFRVVENGYTPLDGVLLGIESDGENSLPYFNIWSRNSPGEWVYTTDPLDSTMRMLFRLARNSYGDIEVGSNTFTSSCYCYDLGRFRGYNHIALGPYISVDSVLDVAESQVGNVQVKLNLYLGEIDWTVAINSDSSLFHSNIMYAKVQVVGNPSICSSYISLEGLMLGEQSVYISLPPEPDYTFEVLFYIFYIDTYYERGRLPIVNDSLPDAIAWSQTLTCMSIARLPVVTELVISGTSYEVLAYLHYDSASERWNTTFQFQYSASEFFSGSTIFFSRYDMVSGGSIYGFFDSIVFEDILSSGNNLFTSQCTFILSVNPSVEASSVRQEYKFTLYTK